MARDVRKSINETMIVLAGTINRGKSVGWLVAEHEKSILPALKKELLKIGSVRQIRQDRSAEGKLPMHWLYIDSAVLSCQLFDSKIKSQIPEPVWGDKEVLRGFLRGMYDGDGGISGKRIALTFGRPLFNQRYSKDIQQALLLFGIRSRRREYKDRIVVGISTKDNPIFCREIGFLNANKQKKAGGLHCVKPRVGKIQGRVERVRSVTVTNRLVPMYDVINSPTHKFMANGLIVHNSAFDILSMAMVKLEPRLPREAKLLLQIHDELLISCPKHLVKDVSAILKECMENPFLSPSMSLRVPLETDVHTGRNWMLAKG